MTTDPIDGIQEIKSTRMRRVIILFTMATSCLFFCTDVDINSRSSVHGDLEALGFTDSLIFDPCNLNGIGSGVKLDTNKMLEFLIEQLDYSANIEFKSLRPVNDPYSSFGYYKVDERASHRVNCLIQKLLQHDTIPELKSYFCDECRFIQANYSKSREQNYDADLQIAQSQIKLWYSEVQSMNYKTKVQIWKSKYLPQVPQSIVCSQPPSE